MARLSTGKVRVNPAFMALRAFKRVARVLMMVLLVVTAFYSLILVPTSVRILFTDTMGPVLTRDPSLVEGATPAGNEEIVVMGSGDGLMGSIFGKMKAGFTYHLHASRVRIIAGPDGRIRMRTRSTAVYEGRTLRMTRPHGYGALAGQKYLLEDQYVVKCLAGDCRQGDYYVISSKDMLGEVKRG